MMGDRVTIYHSHFLPFGPSDLPTNLATLKPPALTIGKNIFVGWYSGISMGTNIADRCIDGVGSLVGHFSSIIVVWRQSGQSDTRLIT